MTKTYYVNKTAQSNGDHEVHVEGCTFMPVSKTKLGDFSNCHDAVREAKDHYRQTNGCYYCCKPCHTS